MFAFKFLDRFTTKQTLCQGLTYFPRGDVSLNVMFREALLQPDRMSMSWDELPDNIVRSVRSKGSLTKHQMNIICAFLDEKEIEYNYLYSMIRLPDVTLTEKELAMMRDISVDRVCVSGKDVFCNYIKRQEYGVHIKFKGALFKPVEMLLEKMRKEIKVAVETHSESDDDGEEKSPPFNEKLTAILNEAMQNNKIEGIVFT